MALSRSTLTRPTTPNETEANGLPRFAANVTTAPDMDSDQLTTTGFSAGDLPEHGDINYLGWFLTKWTAYLDLQVGINIIQIDSIVATYSRWNSVTPPVCVEDDAICPTTNTLIDKKVSELEYSIEPTYFKSNTQAAYDDLSEPTTTESSDYRRTINRRLNTKITNAFEAYGLDNPITRTSAITGLQLGVVNESNLEIDPGWAYLRKFGKTDYTDVILYEKQSTSLVGIIAADRVTFDVETAPVSFVTPADRQTIHLFICKTAENYGNYYIDTLESGLNAATAYAAQYDDTDASDVYLRRVQSLLILETIAISGSNMFSLLGVTQKGDEYKVNSFQPSLTTKSTVASDDMKDYLCDNTTTNAGHDLTNIFPVIPDAMYIADFRFVGKDAGLIALVDDSGRTIIEVDTNNTETAHGIRLTSLEVDTYLGLYSHGTLTESQFIPSGYVDKRIY